MAGFEQDTLAGGIPDFIQGMLRDVHCSAPYKIVSYNKDTKRAEVFPLLKKITFEGKEIDLLPRENVPVAFMGGKSCVIDIEYQEGDNVLVGFTDGGIGGWKAGDGAVQEAPDDLATHQLTNAIVIGGLQPDGIDLSSVPKISFDKEGNFTITNNKVTISADKDGGIVISSDGDTTVNATGKAIVSGSTIELNGSSKTFVTGDELQTALDSQVTRFIPLFDAHVHLGNLAVPTGPPVPLLSIAPPPGISFDITAAKTTTVKTGG